MRFISFSAKLHRLHLFYLIGISFWSCLSIAAPFTDIKIRKNLYSLMKEFFDKELVKDRDIIQHEFSTSIFPLLAHWFHEYPEYVLPYQYQEKISAKEAASLLVEKFCQKELIDFCKNHKKDLLKSIRISDLSTDRARSHQSKENIQKLSVIIKSLQDTHAVLNDTNLDSLQTIYTHESLVDMPHFQDMQKHINEALDQRISALEDVPEITFHRDDTQLLLTKSISTLIQGEKLSLEENDIVQAVEDVFSQARLFFTYQLLKHESDLSEKTTLFVDTYKENHLEEIFSSDKLNTKTLSIIFSDLYLANVDNDRHLFILKKHKSTDALTNKLLIEKEFQKALWRLKKIGNEKEAESLKNTIFFDIIDSKNVSHVKHLGLGAGRTELATFDLGVKTVYKPKTSAWKNPFETFVTNYKNEIAAYTLDSLIGLNMVPITILTQIEGYNPGSQQYFVNGGKLAKEMLPYNKNSSPSKFSKASGRSEKPSSMKFFDWLINNHDRNVENYLILASGRIVLIDHGFTFKFTHIHLTPDKALEIMPSKQIYLNLKKLAENNDILRTHLASVLSSSMLQAIIGRINIFVDTAEKLIKKHGEEKMFSHTDYLSQFAY